MLLQPAPRVRIYEAEAETAAVSGRAGSGKVAAIVPGGNIDLDTFAGLVNTIRE